MTAATSLSRPGASPAAPGQRGFLFVEVLLGMTLLSIVLLAMAPMFILAGRQNTASADMTVTATIAQDKAEYLKSAPFKYIAGGTATVRYQGMYYRNTWTVQNDTPFPGLKTIVITVRAQRAKPFGGQRDAVLRFVRAR